MNRNTAAPLDFVIVGAQRAASSYDSDGPGPAVRELLAATAPKGPADA